MQHNLSDWLGSQLEHPTDTFAPQRVQAYDSINRDYAGIEDRLKSQFAGRGMGRSGQLLTNTRALEASRIGDLGRTQAQYAGLQQQYQQSLLDQALRFSFASPGTKSVGTGPGNMLGGGVGGGLETASFLYGLNKMLGGGGLFGSGGSGGGGGPADYSGDPYNTDFGG